MNIELRILSCGVWIELNFTVRIKTDTEPSHRPLTENNVTKYKPKNAMSTEKISCNEAETGRLSDCAGLMPGPPRVRPGVLYSGLLAGANLTAASTALVRARGVGTSDRVDGFTTAEDHECWHAEDVSRCVHKQQSKLSTWGPLTLLRHIAD